MFPLLLAAQGRQGQALIDSLRQGAWANSKTEYRKAQVASNENMLHWLITI